MIYFLIVVAGGIIRYQLIHIAYVFN